VVAEVVVEEVVVVDSQMAAAVCRYNGSWCENLHCPPDRQNRAGGVGLQPERRTVRSKKMKNPKIHVANREEVTLPFPPSNVYDPWCYNIYEMYSIGSVRKFFFPLFVPKALNLRDIA
jgi:hypothetical protein